MGLYVFGRIFGVAGPPGPPGPPAPLFVGPVEYLVDRMPANAKANNDQVNQDFLNQRGAEGWILVDLDGKRAIFIRKAE